MCFAVLRRVILRCCVLCAAQVLIGEFEDDAVRSQLRTALTVLQPVELVLPAGRQTPTTTRVLAGGLRDVRVVRLRGAAGAWDAEKALKVRAPVRCHCADHGYRAGVYRFGWMGIQRG